MNVVEFVDPLVLIFTHLCSSSKPEMHVFDVVVVVANTEDRNVCISLDLGSGSISFVHIYWPSDSTTFLALKSLWALQRFQSCI